MTLTCCTLNRIGRHMVAAPICDHNHDAMELDVNDDALWRRLHQEKSDALGIIASIKLIAARQAEAIITFVSGSAQNVMPSHVSLHVSEDKIHVTYEAPGRLPLFASEMLPNYARYVNNMASLQKYILGIGSADPRKNIGSLILSLWGQLTLN